MTTTVWPSARLVEIHRTSTVWSAAGQGIYWRTLAGHQLYHQHDRISNAKPSAELIIYWRTICRIRDLLADHQQDTHWRTNSMTLTRDHQQDTVGPPQGIYKRTMTRIISWRGSSARHLLGIISRTSTGGSSAGQDIYWRTISRTSTGGP